MQFLSVCSGIEAASAAWSPLGFKAVAFSEIDKFPSAVLAHHYPNTPNLGDMTKAKEWPDYEPDILVGGTPCQSFSIAGLRKGLADPRGNLMLTYLAIADRYQPEWVVWENVPGVLSSAGGRDFGTFLGALGQIGYGWAYRVLDAQFFGVPQRRRRVFVVGHLGDWRRAAAVLFERHSLQGHPPPGRETGKGIAPTISARTKGGGGLGTDFDCDGGLIANALHAADGHHMVRRDADNLLPICVSTGQASAEIGIGIGTTLNCNHEAPYIAHSLAIAFDCKASGQNGFGVGEIASTIRSMGHANSHQNGGGHQAVAFTTSEMSNSFAWEKDYAPTIDCQIPNDSSNIQKGIRIGMQVRRLTPRECERLQGFPDDYTLIPFTHGKPAADGPRYKALGNSMAVPVMRWIGERIQLVDWLHADS